ncbi:MAG TPA: two pore domain potassium channel family protein [Chloroflexota bacterium]|nr:two pore domain potassium channel family protein [Chloroflexota bacterium]
MQLLVAVAGLLLISLILWEAFESIVLPRRVSRRLRLVWFLYRATWIPWRSVARRLSSDQRDSFVAIYGPLALLMLLGAWAAGLIVGFGALFWALLPPGTVSLGQALYFSGSTIFPLGRADLPLDTPAIRALEVVESGLGVAFLALVIAYLPVMYEAFSRREVNISLLVARAGSPPTAVELMRRLSRGEGTGSAIEVLRDWERWSAELLESHLSYPSVAYFRSQHDNQSWLAALTMILDVSSLVMVGIDGVPTAQAQLTYAMSRHAAVDLAQVFTARPCTSEPDRLPPRLMPELRRVLAEAGVRLRDEERADAELAKLRQAYEPYVCALSRFLVMDLPPWIPSREVMDSWQTSAWDHTGDATGGPGKRESPVPLEKIRGENERERKAG